MGTAARPRIPRGGPRATGRAAASLEEWAAIRRVVFRRARWRCQAYARWGALEVHHVVKRAQGGSDFDLDRLVALCQESPVDFKHWAAGRRGRAEDLGRNYPSRVRITQQAAPEPSLEGRYAGPKA